MVVRVATLNLEQNHKCWEKRRELVGTQMLEVHPDLRALKAALCSVFLIVPPRNLAF